MLARFFAAMVTASLLIVSSSQFAVADPEKTGKPSAVALLSLEISGDGPPELRSQLEGSIIKGLRAQAQRVLGLNATLSKLSEHPQLIGCSSSDCLRRIGEVVGVQHFIRGLIVANGANYQIKLELLTADAPETVANVGDNRCAVCTVAELNQVVFKTASAVLRPSENQPVAVRVNSSPPGAGIWIDGESVGQTPLATHLEPGEHTIVVSMDGYLQSVKVVQVIEPQTLDVTLVKTQSVALHSAGRDFGYWKWGAAVTSAVLLAGGGYMVALDGQANCGDKATCAESYDTLWGGVLSLSGGVILGATATWMFWRETPKGLRTSVQWSDEGAVGRVGFSF